MVIISFVTQKGGSGKTTLAINCAVAAVQAGGRVLLIDLDAQGSATAWYQRREADAPQLVKVVAGELDTAIAEAKRLKFDWVMIDTPPRDASLAAATIKMADFCVIPCRPTPADAEATPPTVEAIKRMEKGAAFVLTQTPPRSFRIKEAERGLGMFCRVAPVYVVSRAAYQDAQGLGLGVTEYEPNGKAAREIVELWRWITKKVEKVTYAGNKARRD
jgi:chromosome partitioning protein